MKVYKPRRSRQMLEDYMRELQEHTRHIIVSSKKTSLSSRSTVKSTKELVAHSREKLHGKAQGNSTEPNQTDK